MERSSPRRKATADKTINHHDDLLKVVDNMLSEAGVDRKELGGELTFANNKETKRTIIKRNHTIITQ